jgi:glycosyltransferase involved in cell wall biosynthesis
MIHVVQILEATTGGTRRHLRDVVLGLDRERFRVSVLCATRRDAGIHDDFSAFRLAGTTIQEVDMLRRVAPCQDLLALWRLTRRLKALAPDIVHTHSSKAGILGRLAARRAGVPRVIHTPHVFAFQMQVSAPLRRLYAAIERRAARWADTFVCVCRAEAMAVTETLGAPSTAVALIPNGIDLPPRPARKRKPHSLTIGFAGRLVEQKGPDLLIEAIPRVHQALPDARVVIVGRGEMEAALRARIDELELADMCEIRVPEPSQDLTPVVADFDLCVMPSRWEGMPYTLLEAMALGVPVVASFVGGIPEVITDGRNGLLVPPGDPAALAAAMARLGWDAGLRRRLGDAARETVSRNHSLKGMIHALSALYAG